MGPTFAHAVARGRHGLSVVAILASIASCRARPSAADEGAPPNSRNAEDAAKALQSATPLEESLPRGISFRRRFDLSRVRLGVEDVHMSTRFDEVLARTRAELVVNGGFFGTKGEPIGLAVSDGKKLSAFAPSMSGGVLWIRDGLAHLDSTESYESPLADFAIQCRPRLVVASRANIKSDDGQHAARTALCIRNGGRELEVDIASDDGRDGPTLFELANVLVGAGCDEALNLDGGPSTGWADDEGGARTFRSPRASVRHAIVVTKASRP